MDPKANLKIRQFENLKMTLRVDMITFTIPPMLHFQIGIFSNFQIRIRTAAVRFRTLSNQSSCLIRLPAKGFAFGITIDPIFA